MIDLVIETNRELSRFLPLIVGGALSGCFIAGQLLTTWRSDWRLERIPFLVCLVAIGFALQFVVAVRFLFPVGSMDDGVRVVQTMQWGAVLLAYLALGAVAAARSRDACGGTASGLFLFVPLVNLWLLISRPRPPIVLADSRVKRQVTGANGVRLIAILMVGTIAASIWIEKRVAIRAVEVARLEAEQARAAAEAEKQARQERLSAELDQFVVEVDAPYTLNDVFTFSEVVVNGTDLVIHLDTSDWFIHQESDAHYYTGVFCRLPGIRGLLSQGVGVSVAIHDPDGSIAISFDYDGSDCDR